MIQFELPIVVAVTTWTDQKSIRTSIHSVEQMADHLIVVYGKIANVGADSPDKTWNELTQLQHRHQGLFEMLLKDRWDNEADKLNAAWFNYMGYFFWIRGNEYLSLKALKELDTLIPKSIDCGAPIVAHTTLNKKPEIRGCQIDYDKVWQDTDRIEGVLSLSDKDAFHYPSPVPIEPLYMEEPINGVSPKQTPDKH
jgi:hypothetical protein